MCVVQLMRHCSHDYKITKGKYKFAAQLYSVSVQYRVSPDSAITFRLCGQFLLD